MTDKVPVKGTALTVGPTVAETLFLDWFLVNKQVTVRKILLQYIVSYNFPVVENGVSLLLEGLQIL